MSRGNSLERIFAEKAKEAGFDVEQASSIRTIKPVENHNGRKGKVVTQPDFYVTDQKTGQSVYVEIGNGKNHDNGHKAAQM